MPVCDWETFAQTTSEILDIELAFTAFKFVHPVTEVFFMRQIDF